MSEKGEIVEVRIEVPKPVMAFYRGWLRFLGAKETAEEFVKFSFEKQLQTLTGEIVAEVCDSMFYDARKEVVEKYGLRPFIDLGAAGLSEDDDEDP